LFDEDAEIDLDELLDFSPSKGLGEWNLPKPDHAAVPFAPSPIKASPFGQFTAAIMDSERQLLGASKQLLQDSESGSCRQHAGRGTLLNFAVSDDFAKSELEVEEILAPMSFFDDCPSSPSSSEGRFSLKRSNTWVLSNDEAEDDPVTGSEHFMPHQEHVIPEAVRGLAKNLQRTRQRLPVCKGSFVDGVDDDFNSDHCSRDDSGGNRPVLRSPRSEEPQRLQTPRPSGKICERGSEAETAKQLADDDRAERKYHLASRFAYRDNHAVTVVPEVVADVLEPQLELVGGRSHRQVGAAVATLALLFFVAWLLHQKAMCQLSPKYPYIWQLLLCDAAVVSSVAAFLCFFWKTPRRV
jgi:hypothetical protein